MSGARTGAAKLGSVSCESTRVEALEQLLPAKAASQLQSCLGMSMIIYVRTSAAGLQERIPRIEATWATSLAKNVRVLAFHEGVAESSGRSSIDRVGTTACTEWHSNPELLQCCKTAQMLYDARQRLRDGDAWSWAFFVDDDVYAWTDHLQLKLCLDFGGANAKPVALGQPGCGKNDCGGFCGGGGIGFSRAGLEKLIGNADSAQFSERFMKMCNRCGLWDDISVGMLAGEANVPQVKLEGTVAWRMGSEQQGIAALDGGTLPVIWHYVRENMPNVHKLHDWAGASPALLRYSSKSDDSKCLKWARDQQKMMLKSPREALASAGILDLNVGKYSTSILLPEGRCMSEGAHFSKVVMVDACMAAALWSPECGSSVVLAHNADTSECICCLDESKSPDAAPGWAMYKVEAWTTIQAYREPANIAKWSIGTHVSAVQDGHLDMFSDDDGSGRQRFVFKKGSGDWYNIMIFGGTNPGVKSLSSSPDGSSIQLSAEDKGDRFQRWSLENHGEWHHIRLVDSIGGRALLGAAPCGCKMELVAKDDGSGRQRWVVDLPPLPSGMVLPSSPPMIYNAPIVRAAPAVDVPVRKCANEQHHGHQCGWKNGERAVCGPGRCCWTTGWCGGGFCPEANEEFSNGVECEAATKKEEPSIAVKDTIAPSVTDHYECNATDVVSVVNLLPADKASSLRKCVGLPILIYVRTGLQGLHQRVPRIAAAWADRMPPGVKVIAFHERGQEDAANDGKTGIPSVETDACRSYKTPELLQCCKTADMLWHARQQLKNQDTAWRWAFFVDDDAYVFLDHLQLKLCMEHGDDRPIALGTVGCSKNTCVGFCGGAGIGFNSRGLEKLVGSSSQEEFLKSFMKQCHTCGMWDDISVGMLSQAAGVSTETLSGTVAWRMDPELQGVRVTDGRTMPLVWHYIRENMPQVHKLRRWAGSTAALLHFSPAGYDSKCTRWARERADQVRKNPREALAKVIDMRVGSYSAVTFWQDSGCKAEQQTGSLPVFKSAEECLPEVLRNPACASGLFMHSSSSGECRCCSAAERQEGSGWSTYKAEGWTTMRAYRPPEAIATWTMGIFLSTINNGGNLDMFFEDDASGRQRYKFEKGDGDWYTISIGGGTDPGAKLISTSPDGRTVRLVPRDTGSGRERWVMENKGAWYNIRVFGGANPGVSLLSMAKCGCKTEVVAKDDGSGRQRWVLDVPGR